MNKKVLIFENSSCRIRPVHNNRPLVQSWKKICFFQNHPVYNNWPLAQIGKKRIIDLCIISPTCGPNWEKNNNWTGPIIRDSRVLKNSLKVPAGPFRRFLSNFCTCYSRMDMFILQDLQSSKFWYIKISCSSNGSDVMTAWPSWNHLGNFWRSDGRTFFNFFLCVVSLE